MEIVYQIISAINRTSGKVNRQRIVERLTISAPKVISRPNIWAKTGASTAEGAAAETRITVRMVAKESGMRLKAANKAAGINTRRTKLT